MASDSSAMFKSMQYMHKLLNDAKTAHNIDSNTVECNDVIICNNIDSNSVKANTIIVYGNVDCNSINAENVLVLNGENDYISLDKKYLNIDIEKESEIKIGDDIHKYSELPSLKITSSYDCT